MFVEMVAWAAEEGVDFVIAETLYYFAEALLTLQTIREAGLEAAVTPGLMEKGILNDGVQAEDACARQAAEGASVVGLNCFRGPETMMPYLLKIREKVQIPVDGLPVPYRTHPTFFNLPDPGNRAELPHPTPFSTALDPLLCNRYEIAKWGKSAFERGIRCLGLCCGATLVFYAAWLKRWAKPRRFQAIPWTCPGISSSERKAIPSDRLPCIWANLKIAQIWLNFSQVS